MSKSPRSKPHGQQSGSASKPANTSAPATPGPTALTFAHPLPVVARWLRLLAEEAPRERQRRLRLRLLLLAGLLLAGALALAVDLYVDMPVGRFGFLVPFTWLGMLIVLMRTRAYVGPPVRWRSFGMLLRGLALLPLLLCAAPYARGNSQSWLYWLLGSGLVIGVGYLLARRGADVAGTLERERRALQCAAIAEALVDDARADKPAVGWLDSSGPQQPHKCLRRGKSRSGRPVAVYRDVWWRVRLVLRDGSRLRLSAIDRAKVREGHWRRGSSGKQKWRAEALQALGTLELQLAANPRLYRAQPAPADDARAQVVRVAADPSGAPVLALTQNLAGTTLNATEVLLGLRALYARLARLDGQPAGPGALAGGQP
jgi:hypothetical protein